MFMANELRHGTWWDLIKNVPLDSVMEGRFTRLFPTAPAAVFADADLATLAAAMVAEPDIPPTPESEVDPEENPGMDAAYTYLGQFIDHDVTLDLTSQLRERLTAEQLRRLVDFRTPRLDLDHVYGRGPGEQPYLYQSDGVHLLLGAPLSGNALDPNAADLPRGPSGRALIGDPRNDENRIVAQLHAIMLRFHNAIADAMPGAGFVDVRNAARWHYQWVVINDFLPTVIQASVVQEVFPHLASGGSIADHPPQFRIEKLRHGLELMPVEFSVAAYRFGHSAVRPIYRLNETVMRRQIFSTSSDPAGDLGGFRPMPSDFAIDWQFFIDLDHGAPPAPPSDANDPVVRRPQKAYKIDTSLVNPLGLLPPSVASNPSSLALRNLERGVTFGLPSGQTVAQLLGFTPLSDDQLVIGKATEEDPRQPLSSLVPAMAGSCPLWTYVLSEAQTTSWALDPGNPDKDTIPTRLGPVGGHIVAEVLAALLQGDRTSFLSMNPGFVPLAQFTHNGNFGLAELINAALGRSGQGPGPGAATATPPPSSPAVPVSRPVAADLGSARGGRKVVHRTAQDAIQKGTGETRMSFTDTDSLIRQLKGEVKLALAKAITQGAERAGNEEECEAVRDLAQAFIFLPVMGDLPDFVHSHGGVAVIPTAAATTTPTPTTPAPMPTMAPVDVGSHAHAAGIADLPSGAETQLDALLQQAGVDPNAPDTNPSGHSMPPATPAPAPTPAPTPVTPVQMRLEQAVEDARLALADALSKASKSALDKSACIVLLAEALNLLPMPTPPDTTGTTPPPAHSHAGAPAPGHSHGTPAPAPAPAPPPVSQPPPVHSHG
jgi:hypothetical protein